MYSTRPALLLDAYQDEGVCVSLPNRTQFPLGEVLEFCSLVISGRSNPSLMEKLPCAAEGSAGQISFANPRRCNAGSRRAAEEGNCLLAVCNFLRSLLSLSKDREPGRCISRGMNYFQSSESDW